MKLTKNFALSEFNCHDEFNTPVPEIYMPNVREVARNLQIIRDHIGEAIMINSGYRTKAYNRGIGGAPNSQHLIANAADIVVRSKTPRQLKAIIEKLITQKKLTIKGIGLYPSFVHVDCRKTRARW